MNNDDRMQEPLDDAFFETSLAALRKLEPSLESRLQNRIALANELQRRCGAPGTNRSPWWRRSISVPIPVAAAAVVLLLAAIIWTRARSANSTPQNVALHPPVNATSLPIAPPAFAYFETETYLCGIGRLKSDHGYVIQEQNQ